MESAYGGLSNKNMPHFVDPTMCGHIYLITVCWNKATHVFETFFTFLKT